jgi:hypothetical protein
MAILPPLEPLILLSGGAAEDGAKGCRAYPQTCVAHMMGCRASSVRANGHPDGPRGPLGPLIAYI